MLWKSMEQTMPVELRILFLIIGMMAGTYMLGMLLWSIVHPERRVWPPTKATNMVKIRVWLMTVSIFAAAFFLGLLDWNRFEVPELIRWCVGLPLILIGNTIVWWGVGKIGMAATSGEASGLKTDGIYNWSRNPQYVADITILLGWAMLSASLWALPVLTLGVAVLAIAPFAEEPWLQENYGEEYRLYRNKVRRFI